MRFPRLSRNAPAQPNTCPTPTLKPCSISILRQRTHQRALKPCWTAPSTPPPLPSPQSVQPLSTFRPHKQPTSIHRISTNPQPQPRTLPDEIRSAKFQLRRADTRCSPSGRLSRFAAGGGVGIFIIVGITIHGSELEVFGRSDAGLEEALCSVVASGM